MAKKKITEAPTISDVTDKCADLYKTEYITSGDIGLDLCLSDGQGIPLGSNIMFFGLPGTGKTTIFCDTIVRLMKRYQAEGIPFRCHYIDSETSRDLLRATGVMDYVYDKEEYHPYQVIYHDFVNTFDYVEDVYDRLTQKESDVWNKDVHLVFIDSVTNLLADTQVTNDVNKADYGDNARARKKLYQKWLQVIKARQITQFWSVQMSIKQNAQTYEDPKKPAVSEFDKHNMDIIVKLTADKDTKKTDIKKTVITTIEGDKEILKKYLVKLDPGQANHTKNRHGNNIPVNVMIYPGKGIINAYILRKMLEAYKYIKKVGDRNFSLSPEFVEFMGPEKLEAAGITDVEKVPRKPNLNKLCSLYNTDIERFFRERGKLRMVVEEEEEEDDGLF